MSERRISSGDVVFVRQAEFALPRGAAIREGDVTSLLCHSDRHGLTIAAIPGTSGPTPGTIVAIPLTDLEPSFDGAEAQQDLPESAAIHEVDEPALEIALSASENLIAVRFSSCVCIYSVQELSSKVG